MRLGLGLGLGKGKGLGFGVGLGLGKGLGLGLGKGKGLGFGVGLARRVAEGAAERAQRELGALARAIEQRALGGGQGGLVEGLGLELGVRARG